MVLGYRGYFDTNLPGGGGSGSGGSSGGGGSGSGSGSGSRSTTPPPPPPPPPLPPLPPLPQPSACALQREDLRTVPLTRPPWVFDFTQGKKVVRDGAEYTDYGVNSLPYAMPRGGGVGGGAQCTADGRYGCKAVVLGQVEEWIVVNSDSRSNHAFHLHVNPFQILGVSMPGDRQDVKVDFRAGDWRDTISLPTPGNVTIRFRPTTFTGMTLAHCHIDSHEDQGMMMPLQISAAAVPGGGVTAGE